MKRMLCLFCALILAVGICFSAPVTITASAATSGTCGASTNTGGTSSVTWAYNSATTTLTISGEGAMADYIGNDMPWYNYQSNIKEVVIENGVTAIGSRAFANCSSLTSVTIGERVTTIGESAFYYCKSLTSIKVDENNAYYSSNEDGVLFNKEETELIYYPLGKDATSYTIPDGVTSIGNNAFDACTALRSITIGNAVKTIGVNTFKNCSMLKSITIPNSVEIIGSGAFCNCTYLSSVTIGNAVKTIGVNTFMNCSMLESITIPNSVEIIGSGAFHSCSRLRVVTIPDSVGTIGLAAFDGCNYLETVNVPCSWDGSIYSFAESTLKIVHYTTKTATCISKAECSVCGEYGDFANHTPAENATYTDNGDGTHSFECTVCGTVTESHTFTDDTCTVCEVIGGYCGATENDNVIWSFDDSDGTLTISGSGAMATYGFGTPAPWSTFYTTIENVVIEKGVKNISDCAFSDYYSKIKSITLPDSVTSIGGAAFSGCTSLTTVTIPDSVTTIGQQAFYGCTSLTSVTIGKGVTEIGNNAFYGCEDVNLIVEPGSYAHNYAITNSIPSYTFNGYTAAETAQIEKLTFTEIRNDNNEVIAYSVTARDTSISGELKIPATYNGKPVTAIGNNAFRGCKALASVTIPDSVTTIGSNAFRSCGKLASVTIPDNVTTIGNYAFFDCLTLSDITIGKSVKLIDYNAFEGCIALTSITIPDSVEEIGESAFSVCTKLTSVTIGKSLTKISAMTFSDCSSLKSVVIPNNVTNIGSEAFASCTALTLVTIPCEVETIGDNAFCDCTNILLFIDKNNINVQNYATDNNINYVVDGSGELEKLTFSINEDGESYSVTGCDTTILGALTIPSEFNGKRVTKIGDNAFSNCASLSSVIIPESVTTIGDSAFSECTGLTSVTIPSSVKTIDKCAFFECVSLQTVDLTGVSSIGENAFCCCTALNSVVLGDGLETIGFGAFFDCSSLEAIELPEGLTTIDESAFSGCKRLKKVTIPKSVTKIGVGAFEVCTSLAEVEISEGVTTIGKRAFQCCESLTEIIIPKSVTSIDAEAFYNCGNLKYIFFEGKEAAQKTIGDALVTNAKIHYGSSTHTFNENYTVDLEPTCTEKGSESQHCKYCDLTQNSKEIKENGHTSVNGGTEKAHTICGVCEEILSATHNPTSKVTKEPTSTEEGVKTYTCECGYSYEEVIPCLVPGEIEAEEAESNSFSATVVDINSIVTKLQLTEEEKALIEQGADMKIVFKLSDIGATINTPEKEAIFKALTNEKIAVFLDIQLVKQIANNSVNVQKLNDLIKVTVELPSEFINKDGNVKRSYSVLRYHDGDETKVTTLNAKFDEATGTLTFETDRFSTYAIVYSDVVVSDGEGVPGTPDPGDGEVSTPETPKDETTPGTPETPKDETTPGTPETPKDDVSSDKTDDSVTNDKNDASSETGTNDKNDTSKDDVPKAGVISTTSIWLGAMALSGLGALLVSKKKKED